MGVERVWGGKSLLAMKIPKNSHFHFDFHITLKVLKEPSVKNCSFNKCEYQHLNQRRRLSDSDSQKHWVFFINPISPPSSLFPKPSHFMFSSLSSGGLIKPLLLHTSCHHVASFFFYPNTPASAFSSSSLSSLPLRLLDYQTRLLSRGRPPFFFFFNATTNATLSSRYMVNSRHLRIHILTYQKLQKDCMYEGSSKRKRHQANERRQKCRAQSQFRQSQHRIMGQ